MMKWTKCAIRFLRISRPGVRVPSIAPKNAVRSKDFMAFLFFASTCVHGFCTVGARFVFSVSELCRARDCIAIRALFCIQVSSAKAELCLHFRVGILQQFQKSRHGDALGSPAAGTACGAGGVGLGIESHFQTSCPAPHGRTAGYERRCSPAYLHWRVLWSPAPP